MYNSLLKTKTHPMMDNLLSFGFPGFTSEFTHASTFVPRVDIAETTDLYQIQVALPGFKKEDIQVDFENNILTIKGERKQVKEENTTYHRIETIYGSFERSFRLNDKADSEAITAAFEHGLLNIQIAKKAEAKPSTTKVEIK